MKTFPVITMIFCMVFLLVGTGCSDDGKEYTDPAENKPQITVIISNEGLGDIGYNDLIMDGIMRFYLNNDVKMSFIKPWDENNIPQYVETWINETKNGPQSLLILAEENYGPIAHSLNGKLATNQQVLVFECDDDNFPENVTSFYIDRYAVNWMAGRMCEEHPSATVIAAQKDSHMLERAIKGFADGYREGSGKETTVHYLSDTDKGYNMPDSAYRMTDDVGRTVILPLAGGSNNGIYKAARERLLPIMVIGMDIDCTNHCQNTPFSVIIRIDSLVEKYMTEWMNGNMNDGTTRYGLKDGMTDIVISPLFYQNSNFIEEYCSEIPDYWEKAYDTYKNQAIRKEQEYDTH